MKCIINGDSFSFDQEQSIYDVLTALELDLSALSLNSIKIN